MNLQNDKLVSGISDQFNLLFRNQWNHDTCVTMGGWAINSCHGVGSNFKRIKKIIQNYTEVANQQ